MSDQQPRHIGRSIGAVLAGMFLAVILTIITDIVLHNIGVFPPWGDSMVGFDRALLLAVIYRTIYGALGSYLTARFAPSEPMKHAMILGVLGFGVSILGAAITWNKGPAFGPHWYPVALIVGALPTAWVGAKVRLMELTAKQKQTAS